MAAKLTCVLHGYALSCYEDMRPTQRADLNMGKEELTKVLTPMETKMFAAQQRRQCNGKPVTMFSTSIQKLIRAAYHNKADA